MDREKQEGLRLENEVTRLELAIAELVLEFEEWSGRAVRGIYLTRAERRLDGDYVDYNIRKRANLPLKNAQVILADGETVSMAWLTGAEDDRIGGDEIQG